MTITVAGGTQPYTYSWSNGTTSKDLKSVGKGDYTVEITDANGCVVTETYSVGFTATNDPSFISKFELYPNPASNYTKVALQFTEQIEGKFYAHTPMSIRPDFLIVDSYLGDVPYHEDKKRDFFTLERIN